MNEVNRYSIERPCIVACIGGDVKATFHGWINDTRFLIKTKSTTFISDSDIIPPCTDVETITNTLALVEFDDGTVKKFNPKSIRFIK